MSKIDSPEFSPGQMPVMIMLAGMQRSLAHLSEIGEHDEWLVGWTIFEALSWASSIDWRLNDLAQEYEVGRFGSLTHFQIARIEAIRFIRNCTHHDFALVLESTLGREEPVSSSINAKYSPDAEWRFVREPKCDEEKPKGRDEYMKFCAGIPARFVLDDLLTSFISLFNDLAEHDPIIRNR